LSPPHAASRGIESRSDPLRAVLDSGATSLQSVIQQIGTRSPIVERQLIVGPIALDRGRTSHLAPHSLTSPIHVHRVSQSCRTQGLDIVQAAPYNA